MKSRINYQNNRTLILQFIISEHLTIHKLFQEWEFGCKISDYQSLKSIFTLLIGTPNNLLNNIYSGPFTGGLLHKLQDSCHQFAIQHEDAQTVLKLCSYVQKILRLLCKEWKLIELKNHPRDSVKASYSFPSSSSYKSTEWDNEQVISTCFFFSNHLFKVKIQNYLKKMSRLIAKLIGNFEKNESMLLFLLENHQALDNIYQFHFVSNLFSKIFKNGIKEAESFMIQQYSLNGYQQLASHITCLIEDFQKATHKNYEHQN